MTRNLKWYLAFSVAWSVVFFIALNWGLGDPVARGPHIAAAGLTYGIGFWLLGYFLGKRDDQSAVRYGLRYAYFATGNLTSAAMGAVWIALFRPSALQGVYIYMGIIAVVALIGAVQARRSIKGMSKEKLFR